MNFFIKVYSPQACAAIQFQVGFVTLRLDKQWPTSSAISNLKPFESLPTNSHVVYMREINHLRRLKWEDAGKGGLKDCRATASSRFWPASGPPSARLSGSATVPNTSSQRPVDDIFKWLRFFGLMDAGFGPVFCNFSKNNFREPFLQFGVALLLHDDCITQWLTIKPLAQKTINGQKPNGKWEMSVDKFLDV